MNSPTPNAKPPKKRLISYQGWITISVIAIIANLHPVPGANIDYMAGRFLGTVLIVAAIWAFVVLVVRWISHRRAAHI